jgi:hypothetical protein
MQISGTKRVNYTGGRIYEGKAELEIYTFTFNE